MTKTELKTYESRGIRFEIGARVGEGTIGYNPLSDTFEIVLTHAGVCQTFSALAPIQLTDEMIEAIEYDANARQLRLILRG